jgi:two-component system NtrC family sensor kinase
MMRLRASTITIPPGAISGARSATCSYTAIDSDRKSRILVYDLAKIYDLFRLSQRSVVLFIILNTFILTAIGFYTSHRLYLRPLNRLVKRTEEYTEQDENLFTVRKEDDDLQLLTRSLNRMVRRISNDKVELKEAVRALEKANSELKTAQREMVRTEKLASLGRMASGIAHEIGNPIGIIMGYLEMIRQDHFSAAEKREFVQRTTDEVDRINDIIQQLLDLAKPADNLIRPVSVHRVLHGLVDVADIQPMMADIDFRLEPNAAKDMVSADAGKLRQVFLNLVINASDAIRETGRTDGRIRLTTENDDAGPGATIITRLIDNGAGIDEQNSASIFDPFFTTKEPGRGTGLGLSVCYMLIEQMGGEISADAAEGGGTMITVLLPLSATGTNDQKIGREGNDDD